MTLTRDIHAPGGIRTKNPSKRTVADRAANGMCSNGYFKSIIKSDRTTVNKTYTFLKFCHTRYLRRAVSKSVKGSSSIQIMLKPLDELSLHLSSYGLWRRHNVDSTDDETCVRKLPSHHKRRKCVFFYSRNTGFCTDLHVTSNKSGQVQHVTIPAPSVRAKFVAGFRTYMSHMRNNNHDVTLRFVTGDVIPKQVGKKKPPHHCDATKACPSRSLQKF
jgi:hypothetical protein